jgi:hypothetical protein
MTLPPGSGAVECNGNLAVRPVNAALTVPNVAAKNARHVPCELRIAICPFAPLALMSMERHLGSVVRHGDIQSDKLLVIGPDPGSMILANTIPQAADHIFHRQRLFPTVRDLSDRFIQIQCRRAAPPNAFFRAFRRAKTLLGSLLMPTPGKPAGFRERAK